MAKNFFHMVHKMNTQWGSYIYSSNDKFQLWN